MNPMSKFLLALMFAAMQLEGAWALPLPQEVDYSELDRAGHAAPPD
jgi:hypothetical protein